MMRLRKQNAFRLNAFPLRFGAGLVAALLLGGLLQEPLVTAAWGQVPARGAQPVAKPPAGA